jgi:hypothetical protein
MKVSTVSFREKSAWATLISLLVVYLPYFIYVFLLASRGQLTVGTALRVFIAGVFFQTIVAILAQIAISIHGRVEPVDERDIAIQANAFRNAYFVLTFGIFFAAMFVLMVGLVHAAPTVAHGVPALSDSAHDVEETSSQFMRNVSTIFSASVGMQVVLLCLVGGEVTRYGTQILGYRRGS